MITYYTTFSREEPTSYRSSTKSLVEDTTYYEYSAFTGTYAEAGTYTYTYTANSTETSTSSSTYQTTYSYTYTQTQITLVSFSDTLYQNTTTTESSSTSYTSAEYGFVGSTFYTDVCNVPYAISTTSYTYTQYDFYHNATKSNSVYETTTHNAPYDHSVSSETYSSVTYSTTETSSYTTTTESSYTDTRYSYVTTTVTITDYPYTTETDIYSTTTTAITTLYGSQTATVSAVYSETAQSGATLHSTWYAEFATIQIGTFISESSSESSIGSYYRTQSNIQTFNNSFTFIDAVNIGYSSAFEYQSNSFSGSFFYSKSGSISGSYVSSSTRRDTLYQYSSISQAGSTFDSWSTFATGSSFSTFTFSSSTDTLWSVGYSSSLYYNPGFIRSVIIRDTYDLSLINTTIDSSTTRTTEYTSITGTTSSIGSVTENTTKTVFFTGTITTSTTAITQSQSWSIGPSVTKTNYVFMNTAYVFEPMPTERMFSIYATGTDSVVISSRISETTKYAAIPQYTFGTTDYYSITFISTESYTGTSTTATYTLTGVGATTDTAYVISRYDYGKGTVVISQTNGTTISPVGAYGYPETSITYGRGIYDITSRSMANPSVSTNSTFRYTITDYAVSETISNADINIHPRMTFVNDTTTSSATVFSLLGVFAFDTTSLANP